jgi:plasmid replication initiation protein
MNSDSKIKLTPKMTSLGHFDEANVARLGLISVQERIPPEYASWEVHFLREGQPASLTCDALPRFGGVPHGLDNDVATALIELYLEEGANEHGLIHTTANALLERAGWARNGHYYGVLRDALNRLSTATYTATNSWYDTRRRWVTAKFHYLDEVEFSSEELSPDGMNLGRASIIRIRLSNTLVRSVRSRYLKPFDTQFVRSLERPLTRALYRLLDAQRYSAECLEKVVDCFEVGLQEWAQACKIADLRPDKVRRTLESAHTDLLERGYLEAVAYEGRGQKQRITYRFRAVENTLETVKEPEKTSSLESSENTVSSPTLEQLAPLLEQGITRPVAQKLFAEFGEERVLERLKKGRHLLSGFKPRNKSAFLVDVIRDDQGKYPDTEDQPNPELKQLAAEGTLKRKKAQVEAEQQYLFAQSQRPLEQRVEAAVKALQFLLKDVLSTLEYSRLSAWLLEGGETPEELVSQVSNMWLNGDRVLLKQQLISRWEQ